MKRDWDLIRAVLLRLESLEGTRDVINPDQFDGYHKEVVSYHIHLLKEAGLIKAIESRTLNAPMWAQATGLTWEGHEFLDSIKTKSAWERVKHVVSEKGFEISFATIKAAGAFLVKKYLE